MVFWLHSARTGSPYFPQTHPSASDFHEYHSYTPRHPQISHRHPPDISREQDMQTDHNRRQWTPPDILKQHLSVFWGVWQCLLVSVGMLCSLEIAGGCLWDVWWVFGGIWVVIMEVWGARMCLEGIWASSPCSKEPKHHFGSALKGTTFFTWLWWYIKIPKPPQISFPKMIGFGHFFNFWEKSFVTVAFDHPLEKKKTSSVVSLVHFYFFCKAPLMHQIARSNNFLSVLTMYLMMLYHFPSLGRQKKIVRRCFGGNSCCTKDEPCALNEGDCDTDAECQGGLKCGNNNCVGYGFDSTDDCCVGKYGRCLTWLT